MKGKKVSGKMKIILPQYGQVSIIYMKSVDLGRLFLNIRYPRYAFSKAGISSFLI